jgi:HD-GYP domain-containing protein (c-di-GMP phosphodiesterase class II)
MNRKDRVMPANDLRNTVRKKLLLRLGLAALTICVALTLWSWAHERDRVSEVVINRARQQVKRFNLQVLPLLDQTGAPDQAVFRRELDEFSAGSIAIREGYFVLAAIYGLDGGEWMRDADVHYPNLDQIHRYMDRADHQLTDQGTGWHAIVRVEGRPYIHVAVPLENSDGMTVAHIEGVFAVSDEEIAAARRRMLRDALVGFLVVLITSIVLYPIISTLLDRLSRLTSRLLDANLETLQVLGSAIAKRDSDTDAHNFRVTVYSVHLAESLGLEFEEIRSLIKGGFLHDVGKIGIRDDVLLKPGRLTDEEFEIMKKHVDHGLDIVNRSEWLDDAGMVVGGHHEKFDGSGYHRGLRGEEIPVNARIFALADVFDALTSRRPYKDPYTYDETMEIIESGRGTHFDPVMLDKFMEIARPLYEGFAGAEDDKPRKELEKLVHKYFRMEVGDLI